MKSSHRFPTVSMMIIFLCIGGVFLLTSATGYQYIPTQTGTQATIQTKSVRQLPPGFVAVEGSGIHSSGRLLEIRCLKDDSVMVFVPGGEFHSGLTKEQIKELAELICHYKNRFEEYEEALKKWNESKKTMVQTIKEVKNSKILSDEELRDVEKLTYEQQLSIHYIVKLESEGLEIPPQDLKRWRKSNKSLKVLLTIPAIQKTMGTELRSEADIDMIIKELTEEPKDPVRMTIEELTEYMRPYQKVTLDPFYIDKYEVTNRRYHRFMAEVKNESHLPQIVFTMFNGEKKMVYDLWKDKKRNQDDWPISCVSATDAVAYAQWAGKSIPTRRQWERAATGDGNRLFPWGSDFDESYCITECRARLKKQDQKNWEELGFFEKTRAIWQEAKLISEMYKDFKDDPLTSAVGQYPHDSSPFGCFDMAGNVSEWVQVEPGAQEKFSLTEKVPINRGTYATFVFLGGNADTVMLKNHVPAIKEVYVLSPKMYGFRTVLNLNARR